MFFRSYLNEKYQMISIITYDNQFIIITYENQNLCIGVYDMYILLRTLTYDYKWNASIFEVNNIKKHINFLSKYSRVW